MANQSKQTKKDIFYLVFEKKIIHNLFFLFFFFSFFLLFFNRPLYQIDTTSSYNKNDTSNYDDSTDLTPSERRKRSEPLVPSPNWKTTHRTQQREKRAMPHKRFSMSLRWLIKKQQQKVSLAKTSTTTTLAQQAALNTKGRLSLGMAVKVKLLAAERGLLAKVDVAIKEEDETTDSDSTKETKTKTVTKKVIIKKSSKKKKEKKTSNMKVELAALQKELKGL